MNISSVPLVPLAEIAVANPRPRNKYGFDQIVTSIATIGLKTPITVSKRPPSEDGTQYDLVCGQGRLEAFLALGQKEIPAIVISASREEQFLMSLVENIARRPPNRHGLLRETKSLRDRGYSADEIANKLGMGSRYISTIIMLLANGEKELIHLVESNGIPLTVAAQIATGTSGDIQMALTEAYEKGDLRGAKLRAARAMIRRRLGRQSKENHNRIRSGTSLTSKSLVKEYQEHTREQRALIKRAEIVRERLALLAAGCRKLFGDPNFVTLLRAENLSLISEQLLDITEKH